MLVSMDCCSCISVTQGVVYPRTIGAKRVRLMDLFGDAPSASRPHPSELVHSYHNFKKILIISALPLSKCCLSNAGSFFSKSKCLLKKWLLLFYWWSREYPVITAAKEADCSHKMAIDIHLWLREVCSVSLCNITIKLGGPNVIIQIDSHSFHTNRRYKIVNFWGCCR